jgi:hypothetical protein
VIWLATAWRWFLSTTLGRWFVGIGVLIAAIGAACLYWFERGKRTQADTDKAKDAQSLVEAAQEAVNAANVRKDVDNETAKLPDAPAQTVASAAPATAAGQLRDDGWVRPACPDGH